MLSSVRNSRIACLTKGMKTSKSHTGRPQRGLVLLILSISIAVLAFIGKTSVTDYLTQANGEKKGDHILNYASNTGEFKRQQSQFRNWISREPGAEFPPEKDRYHLYVSYACPWGEYDLLASLAGTANLGEPITDISQRIGL